MKESDVIRIGLLGTLILASGCNTMAPHKSANSEGTPYPTAIPPSSILVDTVNVSDLAHLPPARETQMVATANAYNPEVLIERGFPHEVINSYRYLMTVSDLKFIVNGEGWQYDNIEGRGGSTIIKSDKPGFENYIYVATAGHAFDADEIGKQYRSEIENFFGTTAPTFTEASLKLIRVGDDLTLTREKFGIVHAFDEESILDYAFIAIPKENIPPNVLEKLMQDAISTDKISFDKITENDRVVGVCEPMDTGYRGVPAENARYSGDIAYEDKTTGTVVTGHAIMVKPWLIGSSCSGQGPFVVDDNGDAKLLGVTVANSLDPAYWDTVAVYPYSDMGQEGFWNNLKAAIADSVLDK